MSEYFQCLDTKYFSDTIAAYTNYIKQFEGIVRDVNKTNNRMIDNWKGKGCSAFEKDCKQVQLNLKDISDVMNELRLALINAQNDYSDTDTGLAKNYDSK